MTEQRDWPPEQSAKGTLRPWHSTAAGYLAVLFEDPEEAQRAQRGLPQRGVPEGDLRLYDGQETLRIASRLQQERSILAKAIKEIEVDHLAEQRWLDNARAGGSLLLLMPDRSGPTDGGACSPTTSTVAGTTRRSWCGGHRRESARPDGQGNIAMPQRPTTSIRACKRRPFPRDDANRQPRLEAVALPFGVPRFGSRRGRDAPPTRRPPPWRRPPSRLHPAMQQ